MPVEIQILDRDRHKNVITESRKVMQIKTHLGKMVFDTSVVTGKNIKKKTSSYICSSICKLCHFVATVLDCPSAQVTQLDTETSNYVERNDRLIYRSAYKSNGKMFHINWKNRRI